MDEEILKKVKFTIEKSTCPIGCRCYKVDPELICRARSTGLDNLLECLEDNPGDCTFSMSFGGSYFCKCSTRIELARLLAE